MGALGKLLFGFGLKGVSDTFVEAGEHGAGGLEKYNQRGPTQDSDYLFYNSVGKPLGKIHINVEDPEEVGHVRLAVDAENDKAAVPVRASHIFLLGRLT